MLFISFVVFCASLTFAEKVNCVIDIRDGLWTAGCAERPRPSGPCTPRCDAHEADSIRPLSTLFDVKLIHQVAGRCGEFYRPRKNASRSSSLVALLLIMAGVHQNPGPAITMGVFNADSTVHKGPLLHDLIDTHRLDALAICESLIVHDDPEAITQHPEFSAARFQGGARPALDIHCSHKRRRTVLHISRFDGCQNSSTAEIDIVLVV
jgi:hypothetical protein